MELNEIKQKLEERQWFLDDDMTDPLIAKGYGNLIVVVRCHRAPRMPIRLDDLKATLALVGDDLRDVFTKPEVWEATMRSASYRPPGVKIYGVWEVRDTIKKYQ